MKKLFLRDDQRDVISHILNISHMGRENLTVILIESFLKIEV